MPTAPRSGNPARRVAARPAPRAGRRLTHARPSLTVLAVLLFPVLAAAPAGAQTLHEDYPRAGRDQTALQLAAQAVVDACLDATHALLRSDAVAASAVANASLLLAGRLTAAADEPRGGVERPEELYLLAPLSDALGSQMPGLAGDVEALTVPGIGRSSFLLHRGLAEQAIASMVRNATELGSRGVQTQPLIDALRQLLQAIDELVPPAGGEDQPIPGAAAHGQAPDVWSILVEPDPVWFGARATLTLVDAQAQGTAQVTFLGSRTDVQVQGGFARVQTRVPWNLATGPSPWSVTWATHAATGAISVVRVPTAFSALATQRVGDGVLLTGRLGDANRAPMHGVAVSWSAPGTGGQAAERGTVQTRPDGSFAIPLGNGTRVAQLQYDGNRTHEPAQAEALVPASVVATPRVVAPSFPWWLLLLLGVLVAAALLLERQRRRRRAQAELPPATPPEVSPNVGVLLAPDHPLMVVLARAGIDPGPLTLREAASRWIGLGAPAVWEFVRRHEETYYAGTQPPPVPQELMQWARRQA